MPNSCSKAVEVAIETNPVDASQILEVVEDYPKILGVYLNPRIRLLVGILNPLPRNVQKPIIWMRRPRLGCRIVERKRCIDPLWVEVDHLSNVGLLPPLIFSRSLGTGMEGGLVN